MQGSLLLERVPVHALYVGLENINHLLEGLIVPAVLRELPSRLKVIHCVSYVMKADLLRLVAQFRAQHAQLEDIQKSKAPLFVPPVMRVTISRQQVKVHAMDVRPAGMLAQLVMSCVHTVILVFMPPYPMQRLATLVVKEVMLHRRAQPIALFVPLVSTLSWKD